MPFAGVQTCARSEEHTSELQSHDNLVCRLLLEKKTRPSTREGPARRPPLRSRRHGSRVRRVRLAGVGPGAGGGPDRPSQLAVALFFFLKEGAPPEFYPFPHPDALRL